jgi:hypothetical protein
METHAVSSNGRYYVYHQTTGEYKGPFFPKDRVDRLRIFATETSFPKVSQMLDGDSNWRGAYFRRLPLPIRRAIQGNARLW